MHDASRPQSCVTIVVNGEERVLERSCTVRELLDAMSLGGAPCAVEVNAALVPRKRHEEHILTHGDCVEVVTLVGGG